MNDKRTITIELESGAFEQLTARAGRQQTSPADLARVYVEAALTSTSDASGEDRRQARIEALEGLANLRAQLPIQPSLDVVALILEGREDIDHRTMG